MIILNEDTIILIKKDRELKTKLMTVLKCSERQLQNYINDNSRRFTELECINTIVEHFDLPVSDLISGPKLSKLMLK